MPEKEKQMIGAVFDNINLLDYPRCNLLSDKTAPSN